MLDQKTLRITEIFYSIQGESNTMGWPTVFIRLTGCPLRCHYCDSAYAFKGGRLMLISEILQQVTKYTPHYVTVTGGEPLAQPDCLNLLTALCDLNYHVSLETSGAFNINQVDPRVYRVVDIKTPQSGEVLRNLWSNINYLTSQDQIKFVIQDRHDYEWAKEIIQQYNLIKKCTVLFSPSYQLISNQELADWIIADRLLVRFQLQMHKYIWGDVPVK